MEFYKKFLLFIGSLIIARWFYKSRSENIINLNEEKIFKSSPIGTVSEYKGNMLFSALGSVRFLNKIELF